MNTLSTETVKETGACYSAASNSSIHTHTGGKEEEETGRHAALTGYFQRGVVAHRLSQVVAGDADVGTFVRFAPSSVDDAKKEERATG